jgi:hypothetical protein
LKREPNTITKRYEKRKNRTKTTIVINVVVVELKNEKKQAKVYIYIELKRLKRWWNEGWVVFDLMGKIIIIIILGSNAILYFTLVNCTFFSLIY